jgi:hypothetical protein
VVEAQRHAGVVRDVRDRHAHRVNPPSRDTMRGNDSSPRRLRADVASRHAAEARLDDPAVALVAQLSHRRGVAAIETPRAPPAAAPRRPPP